MAPYWRPLFFYKYVENARTCIFGRPCDRSAHNEKSSMQQSKTMAVSEAVSERIFDMIGNKDEENKSNWVKIDVTDGDDQSVCVSLRQLQHRRGCSNALLQEVLDTMRPYLRCLAPAKITAKDKKMQVRQVFLLCYCLCKL